MGNGFWHGFLTSDWNTGVQPTGSSNWGTQAPDYSSRTVPLAR